LLALRRSFGSGLFLEFAGAIDPRSPCFLLFAARRLSTRTPKRPVAQQLNSARAAAAETGEHRARDKGEDLETDCQPGIECRHALPIPSAGDFEPVVSEAAP
jgi:hypothetical protein